MVFELLMVKSIVLPSFKQSFLNLPADFCRLLVLDLLHGLIESFLLADGVKDGA